MKTDLPTLLPLPIPESVQQRLMASLRQEESAPRRLTFAVTWRDAGGKVMYLTDAPWQCQEGVRCWGPEPGEALRFGSASLASRLVEALDCPWYCRVAEVS